MRLYPNFHNVKAQQAGEKSPLVSEQQHWRVLQHHILQQDARERRYKRLWKYYSYLLSVPYRILSFCVRSFRSSLSVRHRSFGTVPSPLDCLLYSLAHSTVWLLLLFLVLSFR